jgi:DNA-directed RNA polymerase alpha subunit
MSIDTELIVQILKRSSQGLTPFEILDHLINEPQYQGFSKPSIFSKLLPKLNELRDLQTLVQVSPRWLLIESTEDVCKSDVLVESLSQSDCPDKLEPFQNLEPSIDELTQFNEADQTLSDDAFVVFSDSPIEVLKLSVRTYNCLKRKNINTITELQNYSDIDLMNIKDFGQKSLDEVRTALSKINGYPQLIETELNSFLVKKNLKQLDLSNEETLSDDFLVISLNSPIEVLKLSAKTYRCLKYLSDIKTVGDLQELSDTELMNIRNFGQKSLDEVKLVLSKINFPTKITKTETEVLLKSLTAFSSISPLQIATKDLLFSMRDNSLLYQLPLINQLVSLYPTIDDLIVAFESGKIALILKVQERIELNKIIHPFSMLRNAPQAYLDWLSCFAYSTLIDILVKRQWTPDKLSEVYPRLILSITPPDFRQDTLLDMISGKLPAKFPRTVSEEIDSAFESIKGGNSILKHRLGFISGIKRTLEDIGQELCLTRERVRQIETKVKKSLRFNTHREISLLPYLNHVAMRSLHSNGFITTLQIWTEAIEQLYPAGEIHLPSVIVWFAEFIPEVHILKVADTQLFYMNPISEQIISDVQSQISEFWEEQKISARSQLYQVILPLLPEDIENPEKAANTLISVFCQEPLPNVFSNKKWKMTDYAYYVLHESGKPLHFSEIGDRIKQLKPDWKATNIERAGQGLIDNHPDIIRSGSGIYGLRDWGTMEYTHFREVLLDYLSKQSLPVDADVIHAELNQKYAVSLPTVKMNLDFHPNLFQKFGRSNFYGLKGRYYQLPDQTLVDKLVAKLEIAPASLVELEEDSDFSEYSRDTIHLYLNVSPLFSQVGSSKDRKFGLPVNGKRQYQQGDATQLVVEIFDKIREPLHTEDFLCLISIYYAHPPGESAISRILARDNSYITIIRGIYIPRIWMDDENLSYILEDLDKNTFAEIVKFTLSSKISQPNTDLVFDWLNFCYQNRFFYRGALVFEQLNLSELSDKKSAIARKIGQVCQRNGDISSLSFDQDKNSEEVDRNLRLDLEELRQQAKSGQRASTQGLATLADGQYYARYAGSDVEVHIEKWGGDTTPEMRVLQILCNGEPFDPTHHNPMVNNASLESRLEALQKLYAATLNAYGQVDPYLQIAIGARPSWGVGYSNLKSVLGETT